MTILIVLFHWKPFIHFLLLSPSWTPWHGSQTLHDRFPVFFLLHLFYPLLLPHEVFKSPQTHLRLGKSAALLVQPTLGLSKGISKSFHFSSLHSCRVSLGFIPPLNPLTWYGFEWVMLHCTGLFTWEFLYMGMSCLRARPCQPALHCASICPGAQYSCPLSKERLESTTVYFFSKV